MCPLLGSKLGPFNLQADTVHLAKPARALFIFLKIVFELLISRDMSFLVYQALYSIVFFFFKTDLFENVYGSTMKRRELDDLKGNIGFRYHKPLNSITVSKKRNWLYQSTLRPFTLEEEESKKYQHISRLPISPASPRKHQLSQPFLKPPEEYCRYVVCNDTDASLSRNCSLDFNEENDADDEGEIWYNPIPEEDDVGMSHALSLGEANSALLKFPAVSWRVLARGNLRKAEPHPDDLLCSSEHTGSVQTTQSNATKPVDSIHPTEFVQQHTQRLGHKTQDGIMVDHNPVLKSPSAGKDDYISCLFFLPIFQFFSGS